LLQVHSVFKNLQVEYFVHVDADPFDHEGNDCNEVGNSPPQ